jgi:hypothetical protein
MAGDGWLPHAGRRDQQTERTAPSKTRRRSEAIDSNPRPKASACRAAVAGVRPTGNCVASVTVDPPSLGTSYWHGRRLRIACMRFHPRECCGLLLYTVTSGPGQVTTRSERGQRYDSWFPAYAQWRPQADQDLAELLGAATDGTSGRGAIRPIKAAIFRARRFIECKLAFRPPGSVFRTGPHEIHLTRNSF